MATKVTNWRKHLATLGVLAGIGFLILAMCGFLSWHEKRSGLEEALKEDKRLNQESIDTQERRRKEEERRLVEEELKKRLEP